MLREFRFLWRQFNGPQINAIMVAVLKYCREQCNSILNYFNRFSIVTATNDHLTLIGACMGIVRPLVHFADQSLYLFSATEETGSTRGFSSLENPTVGARLSTVQDYYSSYSSVACPEEYYRKILLACNNFEGDKHSLLFIQNVLEDVWKQNHPGGDISTSGIGIHFYVDGDPVIDGARTFGDVTVYMGAQADWGDAEDAAFKWQGVFQGIFSVIFYPNSFVDVILGRLP